MNSVQFKMTIRGGDLVFDALQEQDSAKEAHVLMTWVPKTPGPWNFTVPVEGGDEPALRRSLAAYAHAFLSAPGLPDELKESEKALEGWILGRLPSNYSA